jgi:hypothetical protein
VAGELARTHRTLPSLEALKPRLLEMLREIEKTLRAGPKLGRLALGPLLGGRRTRVYRDGRIDGVLTLDPETKLPAPGARAQEPADSVVAGDCYTPVASICRSGSRPSWGRSADSPSAAAQTEFFASRDR